MAYKIEVTADSLSELGGKLLALAAQFQAVPAEDTRVPPSPRKKAAPKDEAPKPEPEVVGDQPKAEEPKAEAPQPEPKAEEINFDLEITPLVLNLAQTGKREALTALLDQFGATRASQVPKELWGELLDGLRAL